MAKLVPLFSGSKGNSYYLGSGNSGVLIDAGRSCKQIEMALTANDIDMKNIKAVFVTHEHSDHCSGLRVLANRYNYKIFASQGTLTCLENSNYVDAKCNTDVILNEVVIGDMKVKRIDTSHDSAESCCYKVTLSDGRKAVIATDLGVMSDKLREEINKSDLLLLESNHDINMLKTGKYPYFLKRRVLSDVGHLSNESCASELADFIKNGNNRIVLGHLSQENNMPLIARKTATSKLKEEGMKLDKDYTLDVASSIIKEKSILF